MKEAIRAVCAFLIVGSAIALAQRDVKTRDFSGWLEEYDSLIFVEERNAYIFSNEVMRGKYDRLLLEPIEIYSETGKADNEHAERAMAYLSNGLQKIIDDRNIAASEPGPAVARLRIAITGVEKSKEELKAYHFIPVSAVFRGAQAATGKVPTYMATMFEGEATDAVSGERIMAIVAKGIEETEKRSGDSITFEDFKPTLDEWLKQYAETIDGFLARKAAAQ
jgi:hypothetical protein